jgi:hypothetical protein
MKDELSKFFLKIKSNQSIQTLGETQAKSGIIEPILRILGWDTSIMSDEVTLEFPVEDGRIDYCLHTSKSNQIFLEAKKPSEDLDKHQDQLLGYSFRQGVKLAVLSNGITWSFFLPLAEGKWENRRFYTVDIIEQDSNEAVSRIMDFLSKENVANGVAVKNAEKLLAGKRRQEIIEDSIPDAWNRIITEPDSLLMDLVAERTSKICGFQPTNDDLNIFFSRNVNRLLLSPEDELPEEVTMPTISRQINSHQTINRENIPIAGNSKITADELATEIIRALQSLGGRATKVQVEDVIYKKHERTFLLPYYQQPVSWGLPRWQHNIAWAKEDVKKRGFLKWPSESGRGMWELTQSGKSYKT